MFEGFGKYFLILFIFYLIIVLAVKISLSVLFKNMSIAKWKAYIPFYNKYLLVKKLDLKMKVFLLTFIPFVNLYYYNIIIKRLLEAFEQNSKDSIMFLIVPLYKFPELAFKNPEFRLHLYDNTEEFIHNEMSLFEKPGENVQETVQTTETIINPADYNQTGNNSADTVYYNTDMQPDERKETIIEAKQEEIDEKVNPITVNNLKPKVCPRCGTKLEPTAKTCFFCGSEV